LAPLRRAADVRFDHQWVQIVLANAQHRIAARVVTAGAFARQLRLSVQANYLRRREAITLRAYESHSMLRTPMAKICPRTGKL
jgi:hypothetical protein